MFKSPAFQFYPGDFLADENVVTMTNQEVGCYIKLLCFCWREGSIPKDVSVLARMCGETSERMGEMWPSLSRCFKENGTRERLINPRLDIEREKQVNYKKHKVEAGIRGMESRYGKRLANKAITSALPSVITNANSSSLSSSSSLDIKKEKKYIPFSDIISYLNEKTKQTYKATTKQTQVLIRARWNEGFRIDDFKKVVDNMVAEWGLIEKMIPYLRPATLFGPKFESYLNRKPAGPGQGDPF